MAHDEFPGFRFSRKRKYPDDPKREVFEAAKCGDAVLLSEVLQQMNASERTSAFETDHVYASIFTSLHFKTTPLIAAAGNGHLDCLKVLLKYSADVEFQDKWGNTSLMMACKKGHMNVVSFLVEHGGANVNLPNEKGNVTPLMVASSSGHMNVVSFLVEHGADVNLQDKRGGSPLMYAIQDGQVNILSFLVEHGANVHVDLQEKLGKTPLMYASQHGHRNLVSFLVEHGDNVDLQDKDGNTPLMLASSCGHVDVVTFLVKHGANVNLQNKDGEAALHFCLSYANFHYKEYFDVLSCLITNGADVNACTQDNCTPLMIACSSITVDADAATFLVEHGANMDLQDKNGDTALHHAVKGTPGENFKTTEADRCCVVQKLLNLGTSQLCNNQQLTPLLEASHNGLSLIVDHLLKRAEYTKEQRIDALELLGAGLATCQFTPDTARAFHYIKCGMTERFQDPSHPFFKQPMEPVEAYHFRKESQTLEELAQIEGDRYAIIMEGLIIRERILGTDNKALLRPIRNVAQYSVLRNFDFAICIGLYRHAMKIAQHCNKSISRDIRFIIIALDTCIEDFRNIFLSQKDFVLELLEKVVLEYEKQEKARRQKSLEFKLTYEPPVVLDLSVQLVHIIANYKHFEEDKTSPVSVLLQKLCNLSLRDDHGNTLLHRAVEHRVSGSQKFPCINTAKLLLNSGINVNAISNNGDTPLHKAVTYIPSSNKIHHLTSILEALLDGGAHHDFVNNAGKTAMDVARTDEARMVLSEKRKLELKCISARAVKLFGLPYLGVVPKTLEKFISMH